MPWGIEAEARRELASPRARLLAALIDGVLMLVLLAVPFLGMLVSLVYGLMKDAFPFLKGQSLGKHAMGIRAIKEATGRPLTHDYGASLVRQLSLCVPFFGFLDACMVWSARRQRLGDRWAKTIVIQERGREGPSRR